MEAQEALATIAAALKTIADALTNQSPSTDPQPASRSVAPEPRYMTLRGYAKSRGYSETTVRNWVKLGLPSVASGRGHRIVVAAADQWIHAGGAKAAVQRLARSA